MAVGVRYAYARERLAKIERAGRAEVQDVHHVLIRGVGGEGGEVPRPDHELLFRVDALPRRAGVVRAEDAACRVGRLDAPPQTRGVRGSRGDPDTAERPPPQAVGARGVGPRIA